MVGPDHTAASGWIRREKAGLLTIPTSGWEWGDGSGWHKDDTLKFIYN